MLSARGNYRLQTLVRRGKVGTTEAGIKLLEKLKSLNSSNKTNDGCSIAESPMKENTSTPHYGKSNTSQKRIRIATPFPESVKRPNRALKDIANFYPAFLSSSPNSSKGRKHNSEGDKQSGIIVDTSSSVHSPPHHTEQTTSLKQPARVRFLNAIEFGKNGFQPCLHQRNWRNLSEKIMENLHCM
ncbi:unnamed protein product [Trichobilharzia szidati]|nr:unnamed protein product [Trichobilharzia szidati]